MSANTGIAFHCSIDVAVAHIVQGLTIISSPGSIFNEPIATVKPEVQELTEIEPKSETLIHINPGKINIPTIKKKVKKFFSRKLSFFLILLNIVYKPKAIIRIKTW